jgi:hypothetical protein
MLKKWLIMLGLSLFLTSPVMASLSKTQTFSPPPATFPGQPTAPIKLPGSTGDAPLHLSREAADLLPKGGSLPVSRAAGAAMSLGESLTPEQREAIGSAFSRHEPALKDLTAQAEAISKDTKKSPDPAKIREHYNQLKQWEENFNNEVEKILQSGQITQFQISRPALLDPEGGNLISKDSIGGGPDPAMAGEAVGGNQSHFLNAYSYGYNTYVFLYNAWVYSYNAYAITRNYFAYLAYVNNQLACSYAYYGFNYSYYAYYNYYNASHSYNSIYYSKLAFDYANNGYYYSYVAYGNTGNNIAYYAYFWSQLGYSNAYTAYSNAYYGYYDVAIIRSVPLFAQETDQWCWAATGQMIMDYHFGYYHDSVTQCIQASNAFYPGYSWNVCCDSTYKNNTSYCRKPYYPEFSKYGFTSSWVDSALSWNDLVDQINRNYPFTMWWSWNSGGAHYLVGKGYDSSGNVYYHDPWGGANKVNTYNTVLNAEGQGHWGGTHKNVHR